MKNIMVMGILLGMVGGARADDPKTPREQAIADARKAGVLGPKEVADLAKVMTGAWTCDGSIVAPDKKKIAGKMKTQLELNGAWLHESMDAVVGEGKTAAPLKFEAFLTYEAAKKKWRRVEMNNHGESEVATADPMKDNVMHWSADSFGPDGKPQVQRTNVDISDLKLGVHVTTDVSNDGGKTWLNQVIDVRCKK